MRLLEDNVMSIQQQVKQFILSNYLFTDDESVLSDGQSLIRSGIVDSTGILELIGYVEEVFGIAVDPEEMVPDNFDSVQRVAAFVMQKQSVN
jgi:acyl carrier protein